VAGRFWGWSAPHAASCGCQHLQPQHPGEPHAPTHTKRPQKTRPQGSLTEREAAAIMRTVLEVVAYAHDLGCMHRDIKVGGGC
jgi:hypothetical protein